MLSWPGSQHRPSKDGAIEMGSKAPATLCSGPGLLGADSEQEGPHRPGSRRWPHCPRTLETPEDQPAWLRTQACPQETLREVSVPACLSAPPLKEKRDQSGWAQTFSRPPAGAGLAGPEAP